MRGNSTRLLLARGFLLLLLYSCITVFPAHAQEKIIKGKIISEEDKGGIPGVNIVVKGASTGTISDGDGNYSLSVPEGAETLVFSFIGLETKEIAIGNLSVIDVGMESDVKQLTEVVVTAFGMERNKAALGYSVQSVDGSVVSKVPNQNVVNNLSGRVPGLQVSGNSAPGGSPEFVIRGFSSVSGNNQPLVVVDGVPIQQTSNSTSTERTNNQRFGGGLSEIDPNNIAEISLLKGPNAAALYGSRAANGVILITTKSGAGAKGIGVDANFSTTFENPLVKPKFQDTYGGGYGYDTWYADGWSGTVDGFKGTAGTDESWGAPMDGRQVRHWWSGAETAPLVPEPDNWEQWWQTGQTATSTVAISGGNDQGNFRLSLGKTGQEGIVHNNSFWRNNFRLNSSYKFTDKLSVITIGEYIKSGSDNRNFLSNQTFIWHHRHVNYNQLRNYKDYEDVHIQRAGNTEPPNWQHTYFTNPYFIEEVLKRPNEKDRFLGNIALNYTFNEWLSLMVRTGTDVWTDTRMNIVAYERVRNSFGRGSYSEEVLRKQETNSDMILTFSRDLTPDFKLTAQAGGIARSNFYKRNYSEVQQLTIDGVYNLGNNASPNIDASTIEESQVNSLFGSLQMGYGNFLFLDVTGRNDWSSTLPASNNSFFYPSVSLSAVLTEMIPLESKILSFAKVRASWAQVGNDADPYLLQQVYSPTGLWDGSIPKFAESKEIANSELRPEITTGIELGADIRFLSGKIGLDLTYYDQSTRDQILGVDISRSAGYTRRILNAGEIQNKGVEIMLIGTPVELPNSFRWDVSVNFARNRNQVVELAEGLTSLTLWSDRGASLEARVGEPYGNLYGNKFARAEDEQLIFRNGYPYNLPGQHIIGNITPDWLAGFSNSVSYKGVALNVLLDMKKGGDLYDMGVSLQRVTGVLEETAVGREEGVIGEGVMNVGTTEDPQYATNDVVVPARNFYGYYSGRQYHEAAVFDGTYVKLREASISYTLPAKWMAGNFLEAVSVSVVGRNLAILFKNATHMDPEVSSASLGYSYGQLPSARSMGFSVNVKF